LPNRHHNMTVLLQYDDNRKEHGSSKNPGIFTQPVVLFKIKKDSRIHLNCIFFITI
jgi:hypothetical protein